MCSPVALSIAILLALPLTGCREQPRALPCPEVLPSLQRKVIGQGPRLDLKPPFVTVSGRPVIEGITEPAAIVRVNNTRAAVRADGAFQAHPVITGTPCAEITSRQLMESWADTSQRP